MSRKFLIPSLLAAGFGHTDPLQAALISATSTKTDDPNQAKLFQQYKQDHLFTLAEHRSHRSHSSHSSHRSGSSGGHYSHYSHTSHTSHRSSTGGYSAPSYNPQPVYTPPSTSTRPSQSNSSPSNAGTSSSTGTARPLYTAPTATQAETELPSLSGRSKLFKTIVMHVQVALMGRGIYDGPIDGTVGPGTRAALRTFQQNNNLSVTGTVTPETLDALHVSSQP